MRRKTKKKWEKWGKERWPPTQAVFLSRHTHTKMEKKEKKNNIVFSSFYSYTWCWFVMSLSPPPSNFFFSVEIISLFPNPKYSLPRWCVNHLLSFNFFSFKATGPTSLSQDLETMKNWLVIIGTRSTTTVVHFKFFEKNIFHNIPVPDRNRNWSIKCRTSWEDISYDIPLIIIV